MTVSNPTLVRKASKGATGSWSGMRDKELLDTRICDLGLSIKGTRVEKSVNRLHDELKARNLRLKPHCWLSDDWFSPDGIPGIAIPFYMAHPRLMRLERKEMLEVEGGTNAWCMRILRHEAGHAIDTAFRLHRRKRYREIFGRYSDPYPDSYKPKPNSKNYVLHLEPWYAQSHPSEDFAETFAVWLKPRNKWRTEYKGWKALKKLEFIDELMNEIAGTAPRVRSSAKVDPVSRIKSTLGEHYENRRERYKVDCEKSFDIELRKLFPQTPSSHSVCTAAAFLTRNRAELTRMVSHWTGEYRYNVSQVLREMIDHSRALGLKVFAGPRRRHNDEKLKQNALIMLTAHTVKHLHGGNYRVVM
ncbi:MAG: putative zinc-binding metallopeptidase [Planctomycetota bacterium]